MVEQLVEVPTIVSFSSLQRTVEQNVDIPVVGGGGAGGGLSGFLPGQQFSMPAEQIVDNPAPCLGFGGGVQDFQPVQGSAASCSVSLGHAGEGVCRTFPQIFSKVRSWVRARVRGCTPVSAHPRRLLSTLLVSLTGS